MNNLCKKGVAGLLLVLLAGCGNGGSGSDAEIGLAPEPAQNNVEQIFAADRNGEPTILPNADRISVDLDRLFGDENADPLSLENAGNPADVLDRARRG